MAVNRYTVYLYDIKTQLVTAEVPASAISYDYVMDAAGSASIEMPIDVPLRSGGTISPTDIRPIRTGIAIERGGELVWGGLVWAYRLDLSRRTITLNAQGYQSYYARRHTHTRGNRFRPGREQTDIIKWFIDYMNSPTDPAREFSIKTSTASLKPTNFVRTRIWNPYEYKSISDVITHLCDDITSKDPQTGKYGGGFFYYFEPYWDSTGKKILNRITNTVNRHPYPSNVHLQQGVNCEIADISVDGTGMATTALAVGATDGTSSITPHAEDDNPALLAEIP
ncbi:hypothetical protein, partial [Streptomyces katsurahamanus]